MNEKKPTPLQLKVIKAFESASKGEAVSAYKVLKELQKKMPNAKPPTVYRIINMLVEENLMHKTDDNRFVMCKGIHLGVGKDVSHNVFICNKCDGTDEVVYGLKIPDILLMSSVMRGICRFCRDK